MEVKMKIAISTDGNKVSAHFGRCPEYTIIEIEDNNLNSKNVIKNPGHRQGFLPEFFRERNVDCIIAGGIGRRAKVLFNEFGIETIAGVTGSIDDTINNILEGTLEGGKGLCERGKGKGYGLAKESQ